MLKLDNQTTMFYGNWSCWNSYKISITKVKRVSIDISDPSVTGTLQQDLLDLRQNSKYLQSKFTHLLRDIVELRNNGINLSILICYFGCWFMSSR